MPKVKKRKCEVTFPLPDCLLYKELCVPVWKNAYLGIQLVTGNDILKLHILEEIYEQHGRNVYNEMFDRTTPIPTPDVMLVPKTPHTKKKKLRKSKRRSTARLTRSRLSLAQLSEALKEDDDQENCLSKTPVTAQNNVQDIIAMHEGYIKNNTPLITNRNGTPPSQNQLNIEYNKEEKTLRNSFGITKNAQVQVLKLGVISESPIQSISTKSTNSNPLNEVPLNGIIQTPVNDHKTEFTKVLRRSLNNELKLTASPQQEQSMCLNISVDSQDLEDSLENIFDKNNKNENTAHTNNHTSSSVCSSSAATVILEDSMDSSLIKGTRDFSTPPLASSPVVRRSLRIKNKVPLTLKEQLDVTAKSVDISRADPDDVNNNSKKPKNSDDENTGRESDDFKPMSSNRRLSKGLRRHSKRSSLYTNQASRKSFANLKPVQETGENDSKETAKKRPRIAKPVIRPKPNQKTMSATVTRVKKRVFEGTPSKPSNSKINRTLSSPAPVNASQSMMLRNRNVGQCPKTSFLNRSTAASRMRQSPLIASAKSRIPNSYKFMSPKPYSGTNGLKNLVTGVSFIQRSNSQSQMTAEDEVELKKKQLEEKKKHDEEVKKKREEEKKRKLEEQRRKRSIRRRKVQEARERKEKVALMQKQKGLDQWKERIADAEHLNDIRRQEEEAKAAKLKEKLEKAEQKRREEEEEKQKQILQQEEETKKRLELLQSQKEIEANEKRLKMQKQREEKKEKDKLLREEAKRKKEEAKKKREEAQKQRALERERLAEERRIKKQEELKQKEEAKKRLEEEKRKMEEDELQQKVRDEEERKKELVLKKQQEEQRLQELELKKKQEAAKRKEAKRLEEERKKVEAAKKLEEKRKREEERKRQEAEKERIKREEERRADELREKKRLQRIHDLRMEAERKQEEARLRHEAHERERNLILEKEKEKLRLAEMSQDKYLKPPIAQTLTTFKTPTAPAPPVKHINLNSTYTKADSPTSYDMTPRGPMKVFLPSTETNYNIDDLSSGDSTDEDDNPRKKVPKWAKGGQFRQLIIGQYYSKIDLSKVFEGLPMDDINLEKIFNRHKSRYKNRTSSACWDHPAIPLNSKYDFKKF